MAERFDITVAVKFRNIEAAHPDWAVDLAVAWISQQMYAPRPDEFWTLRVVPVREDFSPAPPAGEEET